jgi:AcrR family transcriptional regulator
MTDTDQRRQRVEDACTALLAEGHPVTFDNVATRAGLGRATLYRNPDLRALVEEHRTRGREAHSLTGLAIEIEHLRIALNALATKVRQHDEQLRRLRRSGDKRTNT